MNFETVKSVTIQQGVVKQIIRKNDGKILWKAGYKNWIPYAIDGANGNIFDGVGYRDGYRLSSSGGLSAQANTFTSGFIPYKSTDIIRMGGVSWVPLANGYCYLAFYDSSFTLLGSVNQDNNGNNYYRGIVTNATTISTVNSVTMFKPDFSDGSNVAYFRINGYGNGADAIVTINEEIA